MVLPPLAFLPFFPPLFSPLSLVHCYRKICFYLWMVINIFGVFVYFSLNSGFLDYSFRLCYFVAYFVCWFLYQVFIITHFFPNCTGRPHVSSITSFVLCSSYYAFPSFLISLLSKFLTSADSIFCTSLSYLLRI